MKNVDVIKNFVNGSTKGKTANLYIEGDKLFNYNTCIAQRVDNNNMIVNMTKYSTSTSTIQNKLLDMMMYQYGGYFTIVKDVEININSLD